MTSFELVCWFVIYTWIETHPSFLNTAWRGHGTRDINYNRGREIKASCMHILFYLSAGYTGGLAASQSALHACWRRGSTAHALGPTRRGMIGPLADVGSDGHNKYELVRHMNDGNQRGVSSEVRIPVEFKTPNTKS